MIITNIRGELANKLDEIKVITENHGVYVIAITKTRCTSSTRRPPRCLGSTFTGGTDKTAADTEVSPATFETRS